MAGAFDRHKGREPAAERVIGRSSPISTSLPVILHSAVGMVVIRLSRSLRETFMGIRKEGSNMSGKGRCTAGDRSDD